MNNSLSKLTIALSLGFTCTISLINPSIAQTSNDEGFQSNEQDDLYGGSTLGVNPMDLIHNYNLRVGRNAEEFNEDSNSRIQDSAAEFRRLQQERLLQQKNNHNIPEVTEETAE